MIMVDLGFVKRGFCILTYKNCIYLKNMLIYNWLNNNNFQKGGIK